MSEPSPFDFEGAYVAIDAAAQGQYADEEIVALTVHVGEMVARSRMPSALDGVVGMVRLSADSVAARRRVNMPEAL